VASVAIVAAAAAAGVASCSFTACMAHRLRKTTVFVIVIQ
jgi:hypothetical protein